jgi:heptosyltransferase-1
MTWHAIMAEILFIKTSSLGDVVHHMPAVADARRQLPDARLSWVVEEPYAPLARLHPGIDEVIPVASRRWRTRLHRRETWSEIDRFRRTIREREYDAVVDTQGLLRTAVIARTARGVRHGYDMASIREPLASMFYDIRHRVEWRCHAIPRNRMLTGRALGYEPAPQIEFGLDRAAIAGEPRNAYAMLIHGTARADKEWPQLDWLTVARALNDRGLEAVVPWGTAAERRRSDEIVAALGCGEVPERRPLDEVAALIAGATVVVGVDTGLLHVAGALGVPLVGIFVGSEPGLTGPLGAGPIAVVGGKGALPDAAEVLRAVDRVAEGGP